MRLNWKTLRYAVVASLLALSAGCGGIQASRSVSPATFLLPGLLQADPPAEDPNRDLPGAEEKPGSRIARL